MSMNRSENLQKLVEQATIYHFKLTHKIHYHPLYMISYAIAPLLFLALQIILYFPVGLIEILLECALLLTVHTAVVGSLLAVKGEQIKGKWSVRAAFPWIGLLPLNFVLWRDFRKLQLHLLIVGIVVIGCLYPWVPVRVLYSLLVLHGWLMLPSLVIGVRLRSANPSSVIKLNPKDTSCYTP